MSSIASITTFGFGSYSNINLAVILGYGIGIAPPSSPTSVPGPGDGVNDKRKLLARIRLLKAKKRLKEKERRQLALYEYQVKQQEIQEQFEVVALQKQEINSDPAAIQLFKNLAGPKLAGMAPVALNIFADEPIDDSDLESEEWLMLGD